MSKNVLCLVFLMLICIPVAFSQKSRSQLEREIQTLQEDIATTSKLLKKTSKDKEMTLNEVSLLDKKIKQREKLVVAYKEQIAVFDKEIINGQGNIKTLNAELKKLRKEYAQMIAFANKNRSHYDKLEFIFASDDFNQAFSRLRYIRQITESRKSKMNQIVNTERRVTTEVEASQRSREQQAAMLAEEKTQQAELKKEKEQLNLQIASLKKKEGQLQQDIKKKQQQTKQLQKAIDDLIAEEIRLANERAKKEAAAKGDKTGNNKGIALTPAEKTLSTTFSANKGKLPWPVERGVVSSSYGKHASVVSDKVMVTNSGIDIATDGSVQARAVFDGVVTSVTKLTGSNTVVIIRHGEYFTVYSNIEEALVKRGDNVKTKQNIGRIHTNKAENKTELHFELLKGQTRDNPEAWLAK